MTDKEIAYTNLSPNGRELSSSSMCFNAQTSWLVWFVSTALGLYYKTGNRWQQWIGDISIAVAGVQLLEAFAWMGYADKVKRFVIPVLWSQTLVNAWHLSKYNQRLTILPWIFSMFLLKSFMRGDTILMKRPHGQQDDKTCGKWCHMTWINPRNPDTHVLDLVHFMCYISGLLGPLLLVPQMRTLGWYGLITFVGVFMMFPQGKASSLWCFVANMYWFVALHYYGKPSIPQVL